MIKNIRKHPRGAVHYIYIYVKQYSLQRQSTTLNRGRTNEIWAARAQCTKALAADLSVITKVNVLEIRAARAQCTKALVAELSGI